MKLKSKTINKTQIWRFETINKIDKPLSQIKEKEKTRIISVR